MIGRLELPGIPRSLNQVGSRGSHFAWQNEKKKWEGMIYIALIQAKVPKSLVYVEATATIHPPTNHKRDEGNFRTILEKALGDILQVGGWLADDSSSEYRFGRVEFGERMKPPMTVLMIEGHLTTDTIPDGDPETGIPSDLRRWRCPTCEAEIEVEEDVRQPYCCGAGEDGHDSIAMRPLP